MRKIERDAIIHAIEFTRHPCVPGSAFDENMKPIKVEQLVPGTPNINLLNSDFYKAGYRHAHDQVKEYLTFILGANDKDLKKFLH